MASQQPVEDDHTDGDNHIHQSGDTTPEDTGTISTGLIRKASAETLASSTASTEVESLPSVNHPPPPYNTPENQSVAGDPEATNLYQANAQLRAINLGITVPSPPITEADANADADTLEEGKAHLRTRVRSDVPLLQQLFKRPPKIGKRVRSKVTRKAFAGPSTPKASDHNGIPHFHEHTTWTNVAKEDIERGLQRLATAARDEHQIDGSKTVQDYYSEKLAEVIKRAEIKFDVTYLQ